MTSFCKGTTAPNSRRSPSVDSCAEHGVATYYIQPMDAAAPGDDRGPIMKREDQLRR